MDRPSGTPLLDLNLFYRLATAAQDARTQAGAVASVERSPDDGRPKAAVWLGTGTRMVPGNLLVDLMTLLSNPIPAVGVRSEDGCQRTPVAWGHAKSAEDEPRAE